MWADVASSETPALTHPDGRRLGPGLAGPVGLARTWRRCMARVRSGRLPPMVASYPDGRRFRIDGGDRMYEQVYRLGEYEPTVTKAIRGLLQPGDFAVDVGANHGWFAVVMAHAVGPGGAVWAVEPGRALVAALRANLELNPGLPVSVHSVAVGGEDGEVVLHHFSELPHGHASTRTLGHTAFATERVACRTLDGLLARAPGPPALIKLDVEGSELEALRGASGVLGAKASMWVIEVNREASTAFGYAPTDLLNVFSGDYAVHRLVPGGLTAETDPGGAPHGAMWLCSPPVMEARTAELVAGP